MKNFLAIILTSATFLGMIQFKALAQLTPGQELRKQMRELLKPQILESSCNIGATEAIIRCKVYFPTEQFLATFTGSTSEEQARSEIRFDTSTTMSSYTRPLIGLRIPVYINGCRSMSIFRKNTDTVFIVQQTLTGLKPATTYFVRLWQTVSYLNFDAEQTDGSPFSSDSVFIRFTTASVSSLPTFLSVSSIVNDGFTLRWTAPDGLQATCTLELSSDAQFQTIMQSRTVLPTDSIRFTKLLPNTSYFYRLRVQSGNTITSIVGDTPVRTLSVPTLAATQMSLHTFLRGIPRPYTFPQELFLYYCSTDARYYRYRKNMRLSLPETEALLQSLTARGIRFDTAWAQSNTTCSNDSAGIAELIVKVPRESAQMDTLGFTLGHTDWAGPCECRQFRTYTNFTPTAVQEQGRTYEDMTVSPNPAKESATLSFSLSAPAPVLLTLHDVLGREVVHTPQKLYGTGAHEVSLAVDALPAGIYFLRCSIGERVVVRRVVVVR
jgi:hypothetical protein